MTAGSLRFEGRDIATWKGQQAARIDVKALQEEEPDLATRYTKVSTTRVLRLKKGK